MKFFNDDSSSISIFLLIFFLLFFTWRCKTDADNEKDYLVLDTIGNDVSIETAPPVVEYAYISYGTFTMGSPKTEIDRIEDEVPHKVTLADFRMSKCEITNKQYAAFLNVKKIDNDGIDESGLYPNQVLVYASTGEYDWGLHYKDDKWIPVEGYDDFPVINVTWYGAKEFARFMGGDLPTEAQWEYAARSGTTSAFNTGNCLSYKQANFYWGSSYCNCPTSPVSYLNKTVKVGSFTPNSWGLFDMHGNVWEWCNDWYGFYPLSHQYNPTGATIGLKKIQRGGGCNDAVKYCRSAYRLGNVPDSAYYTGGFRIVLNP